MPSNVFIYLVFSFTFIHTKFTHDTPPYYILMDVPHQPYRLSNGSLIRVLSNEPLELPIFLQVLEARVVPVVNRGTFYRLWLFDGTYKTSYGLTTYDNFWTSQIDLESQTNAEKVAIIRVNKIRCQTIKQINRPAIHLDSVNVLEHRIVENLEAATDLDSCFEGELENFDLEALNAHIALAENSQAVDIKPLMSISLKTKEELVQQLNSGGKCHSQPSALNAVNTEDQNLASLGQVRARLTFMSPLIWSKQGTHRRLTFSARYFKISGTISHQEEIICDLPNVNEGCILKNIPEVKERVVFERYHFGGPANTDSLPEIKYNFIRLDNVRGLATGSICDLIGVLSGPPKQKERGRDIKKMVLNICDPTCKFDLPIEVWPTALTGLDLDGNPVIAVFGARRTSLIMSCVTLRADSMLLVNPKWLKECKKLKSWWDKQEESVEYDAFNEVPEVSENHSTKEFIIPKLTVADTKDSLCFEISCTICNKMAFELAQPTFVCNDCGPIEKVTIENIKTSLLLHDGKKSEWVTVKDQQMRSLLGLPSPLYGVIGNPELYTKVAALKTRQIRARIRCFPNCKIRFSLLEAQYIDEDGPLDG